ncbi:MAG: hypothetical protein JXK93_09100 [Sphaerochaetaceae bacterium]|nr:hypothetical protein [Sphaerochaetaceae bacterium]
MKKISEEILYKGKWLSLKKTVYAGRDNERIEWESVERNNHSCSFGIIARLIPSNRYILIKQFRQAIDNHVIALPAGIVDTGMADRSLRDACILQELKEETGYTGTITGESPVLKLNPAIMDNDFLMVSVEIDENSPENSNPAQRLEPAEEIEIILIEQERLRDFFLEQTRIGVSVSAGVWFLIDGFKQI